MKILGNKILIEPVKSAEKSAGGIIIQDSSRALDQEGIVLAIGSGIREAKEYRKGSKVFIEMYQGKSVKVGKRELLLVDEKHICGISVNDSFQPIGDRILLKQLPSYASTIIRPSAYERDADEILHCTVQAVGSGIKTKKAGIIPFEVSIGNTVIILPTAGRDVQAGDDTYKLVKHGEVLGKVEL